MGLGGVKSAQSHEASIALRCLAALVRFRDRGAGSV